MRSTLRNIAIALWAMMVPAGLIALLQGPDPRHTGAPGDQPLACATAGCHTGAAQGGPINFYGGSVTATFSGGATYAPGGDPVNITVRVSDPANTSGGFQMTARLESNLTGGQAGRFTAGDGSVVLCDNGSVRLPSGDCPANFPVEFIEHNNPSTTPWTFTWTPPATDAGPVHFYIAGNAVNGNAMPDGGDHVYTAEYVLTPIGACTTAAPAVASVISAGAFGARPDFASGSWLEIYGSNLSTTTKEWAAADFQQLAAPQQLDRVRVSVNGEPAFVRFVSPGQVNVQAPAGANGSSSVTVTNCTETSGSTTLTRETSAPGMLAPPGGVFEVDGRQFLVALFADGAYVGEFAGINSRPARPGDRITTYGIGFGPTEPAFAPGTIAGGLNTLTEPLIVAIGGVTLSAAQVEYKGLAPGFIGLYQFNLVIPELPDGDHPVTISVGGRTVSQTLFLRVRR